MSQRGLVNLRRFRQVVPFKRQAFDRIVSVYMDDTLERLALIEKAVRAQSPKNVKVLAHSALGASRMLGLLGVAAPLEQLEEMGSCGDLAGAQALVKQTLRTLKRTQTYLGQIKVDEA